MNKKLIIKNYKNGSIFLLYINLYIFVVMEIIIWYELLIGRELIVFCILIKCFEDDFGFLLILIVL